MNILCVTQRTPFWEALRPVFAAHGAELQLAPALDAALTVIAATPPALCILDLEEPEDGLRAAVIKILTLNAAVHTAAVTSLDATAFHDRMEGLGMLMGLPSSPSAADIERLLEALRAISA